MLQRCCCQCIADHHVLQKPTKQRRPLDFTMSEGSVEAACERARSCHFVADARTDERIVSVCAGCERGDEARYFIQAAAAVCNQRRAVRSSGRSEASSRSPRVVGSTKPPFSQLEVPDQPIVNPAAVPASRFLR